MKPEIFKRQIVSLSGQMFRFARSILSSKEEAEDVVSELLEQLWLGRDRLMKIENIESYTMKMTRNRALDHLRRRREQSDIREAEREQYSEEGSRDRAEIVQLALKQLSSRYRQVIHLKDIEGYENEEVAQIMGIEVDSVRMTLSRARGAMRVEVLKIMSYEGVKR